MATSCGLKRAAWRDEGESSHLREELLLLGGKETAEHIQSCDVEWKREGRQCGYWRFFDEQPDIVLENAVT